MNEINEFKSFIKNRESEIPYSKELKNKILNIIANGNIPEILMRKLTKIELAIFYKDNVYFYSYEEPEILLALIEYRLEHPYGKDSKAKRHDKNYTLWFKNRYLISAEDVDVEESELSPIDNEIFGFSIENIKSSYLIDEDILNNILFFFDFSEGYSASVNYNSGDFWWDGIDYKHYIAIKTTSNLRNNLDYIGELYSHLLNISYKPSDFLDKESDSFKMESKAFKFVIKSFKKDSILNFANLVIPIIEYNIRNKLPIDKRVNDNLRLKTLSESLLYINSKYPDSTYLILWQDILTNSTSRNNIGFNLRNEIMHSLIRPLYKHDAVLLMLCYLTSINKNIV